MPLDDSVRQSLRELVARFGTDVERLFEGVLQAGQASAMASAREALGREAAEAIAGMRAELAVTRDAMNAAEEATLAERSARAGEREAMLAEMERLLSSVRRIDAADSIAETLDAVANGVAAEAARSMLFVCRGGDLRAWRVSGFDAAPPSPLVVPLSEAGDLAAVVECGDPVQLHPDAFGRETAAGLAFARLSESQVGLAVPLCVGREVIGVIYADDGEDSEREVPGAWPEAVELLARHASRKLESLTAAGAIRLIGSRSRASRAARGNAAGDRRGDAERYARLLISEIKLYNEPIVRVGRERRDLRARLGAEIDQARRLFNERVPATLADRAEVFERELIRTLAEGDAGLLGER